VNLTPSSTAQRRNADVLVLGGGVIGLASALMLLRAGRSVTVLEKVRVGAGASHGNCGTITPSHLPLHHPGAVRRGLRSLLEPDAPLRIAPRFDPKLWAWLLAFARQCNEYDYRRVAAVKSSLLLASQERLRQLVREESLDCEFAETGTLYVWRDPEAFEQAASEVALLQQLGIPVRLLDGAAAEALEPALLPGTVGAVHNYGDSRLRPDRYVAALAQAVRAAGGEIVEGVEIQGFLTARGGIESVATPSGRWRADRIVFALGAWSPVLGRQIGLDLPIQPGKGYSITYPRPGLAPRIPLVLKERGVCVTAWDSGYRLGSTMEFTGYDASLNRTRLDALERGARAYLREPTGPAIEEQWNGWRPMTPDDLPIIGFASGYPNLLLATGHGMLGVSLSAITGQLVTELLTGQAPSLDLAPYAPGRFG